MTLPTSVIAACSCPERRGPRPQGGALALTRPDDLAGMGVRELLARVSSARPQGGPTTSSAGATPKAQQGLNIARVVGLLGGLLESRRRSPSTALLSGLQAIAQAAERVAFGSIDVAIGGGVSP